MIIFGLRSGNAKQKENNLSDCAHCGASQSVQLHFLVRYFHIFWIPLIPLYKTGVSQCNHCKQVLDKAKMPPHLLAAYTTARKKAKTPLRYYSWLILVSLFAVFAVFAVFTESKDTQAWLQQPQAGDVYEMKKDGTYTLYRVKEIKGDTVFVNLHQYTADKLSALRKLKKNYPNAYSDSTIGLAKAELTALYAARTLKRINRK